MPKENNNTAHILCIELWITTFVGIIFIHRNLLSLWYVLLHVKLLRQRSLPCCLVFDNSFLGHINTFSDCLGLLASLLARFSGRFLHVCSTKTEAIKVRLGTRFLSNNYCVEVSIRISSTVLGSIVALVGL